MKRLLGFAVVVAIAWYGWKNYANLRGAPMNEVVILNSSPMTLGRVRLSIGSQEYPAYDSLYVGKSVTQKFPLAGSDGEFHLWWSLQGKAYETSWTGGKVTAGPVRMRHTLQVLGEGSVIWSSAIIPDEKK